MPLVPVRDSMAMDNLKGNSMPRRDIIRKIMNPKGNHMNIANVAIGPGLKANLSSCQWFG
jgi:hypothetical protein